MSVELTAIGYVGICDECGKSVPIAATNPKAATAILREHGWRRNDHVATTRQYVWSCGCDVHKAAALRSHRSYRHRTTTFGSMNCTPNAGGRWRDG